MADWTRVQQLLVKQGQVLNPVARRVWYFDLNYISFKGFRWMPWEMWPKKDVVGCDKPRGAAKQALIRGCPNGEIL